MRRLWLFLMVLLAFPAQASEIIGALSQNRVSLTASFSGSEILIFGAVRRETPQEATDNPSGQGFDVIVVVEGPRQSVTVWRKERWGGIWMNVASARMVSIPSFYAVASTRPLERILSPEADAEFRISTPQAIRADLASDTALFAEALMRIRERASQYLTLGRYVHVDRDILFRTVVQLPANLTEGAYVTRMYLIEEGTVVSQYRTAIFVRKDGIERWLHQLAYDQPFLYGLLALAIALVAGWGAAALVQVIRER